MLVFSPSGRVARFRCRGASRAYSCFARIGHLQRYPLPAV